MYRSITYLVPILKKLKINLHDFFQESEEFLSGLVVGNTVHAKVDRLAGIINFQEARDPSHILNDWSHNLNSLMQVVNRTMHLITKEQMVHKLH